MRALQEQQRLGMNPRPGGLPEWVEMWGVDSFRKTGYVLAGLSAASVPLALGGHIAELLPVLLTGTTAGYWALGLKDIGQKSHTLRRNFPVMIHFRYLLEGIRPEIQQYLIEDEQKMMKIGADTHALGTRRDVYSPGYEWAGHSMFPEPMCDLDEARVLVGGPACKQPYSAALLNISAMSYGSLSGSAALNLGAKKGGFYHNTGEGGISKYHLLGADVVWNVGTGYFACGKNVEPPAFKGQREFDPELFAKNATRQPPPAPFDTNCLPTSTPPPQAAPSETHLTPPPSARPRRRPEIKMIEIKLSQGAKPSHGGILPANKITPVIADARGLGPPPWSGCSSPPVMPRFKMCVGRPEEFAALCHAMIDSGTVPDFITIDGGEGGTGAAPAEFQDSLGMPARDGLRFINSMLIGCNLRDQVKLIVAGKALKCNSNHCPTGITTQQPHLESGLDVGTKALRVANYQEATVHSALEIIGALGCKSPKEVTSDMIYRRSATNGGYGVENYADLQAEAYFAKLPEGALVDPAKKDQLPPQYVGWWEKGGEIYKKAGTA
ncbi:hypothetical protein EMIHUDRAFT_212450 [Emiliania huxleyi CCMP1516]|uniref:Glutamate synthase domain-containing protein n=2 Tax=Emiliania huxleyi TaxID=2903 RepID=A0A0D3IRK0_EMIH1|nr:hypothetical protein EMIHUDRAFT_212450 [Emiliania huxleyi CCMP1516]EOD13885.1 hypothetical protein EMIHUDRAFT_212450 [Emiliania huxleyi CCMP1516]|eukprot:XP_005766314.1 hypothetical protein EMIHUDRAFT_212450 [Emiliania huxleyi CCMP1516]